MADTVQEGDKVSWSWNGSKPSGVAAEVKAGDVTVTSHRGNDITKTGTKDDPAVHIERSGNDVVKTVSELKVEQKGDSSNGASSSAPETKKEDKDAQNGTSTNGHTEEAKTGEKRKADEPASTETKKPAPSNGEPKAKKQKANGAATETAKEDGKKKPGRPKGNGAKEKKEARVGTAARKTRSQGKAE